MSVSCTSYAFTQNIKIEEQLKSDDIQLWDILLSHASEYLYKKNEYQISIDNLLFLWNNKSINKTEDQLKEALNRLGTRVTYQIKRNNRRVNGFFVLLSWVCITGNTCHYAYSTRFKELNHYPQIASYLNQEGITCAQNYLKKPSFDISLDNLTYYNKVLLRSYSLISQ
jgi:hypothetical protein